jgi:hypothetical protein
MHALRQQRVVTSPVVVAPVHKRNAGWKVSLIVFGVVAVLGLFLVIIGGSYFALRNISKTRLASTLPAAAAVTQGNLSSIETVQSNSAQTPPPAHSATQPATPMKTATTVTPFLNIQGFPDDIPILTDNNGDLMTSTAGGTADNPAMTTYMFSTNMTLQEVMDFYKTGMTKNGWTIMSTTTGNNMVAYAFTKGNNRTVALTIVSRGQKPGQQVMIAVQ